MKYPLVTSDDHGIRPAGKPDECFYCNSKVGIEHGPICVVVTQRVKLRAIIEFEVEAPHYWTKKEIEFHRNEGTWCAGNLPNDIEEYRNNTESCMCRETTIEFVEVVDDTPMITGDSLRKQKT